MSLCAGRPVLRAAVALASVFLATGAPAQPPGAPPKGDNGASRVLEIERVLGGASIRREGRTLSMQPGFLLFSGEQMTLMPGSRVDLRLLRYGDIDAMAAGGSAGQLSFEKLPFSSWAVDLATHIRLDSGVLRVRWARSGEAQDWPMAVLVDRWKVQLSNGEFLFRRDERGMVSCSVSGKVELVDDNAGVREELAPGRCLTFTRDGTTDRTELAIAEWPELGVVLLRDDIGGPPPSERSLAVKPRAPAPAPVVEAPRSPSPSSAPAGRPPSPPVPPRVPLAVAEESVRTPSTGSVAPTAPEPPPAADAAPVAGRPTEPAPEKERAPSPAPVVAAPAEAAAPPHAIPEPPPAPSRPADPAPAPPHTGAAVEVAKSAPSAAPTGAPAMPPVAPPAPAAAAPSADGSTPTPAAPSPTLQANAEAALAEGAAGTGPEWIVNVMTVTDPDVAKQHIATLTSAGYPAVLRKEVVRGRTSYRVIIGGISNEQGARRTAQLLSSRMGYTAAWPLQKR